MKAEQLQFLIIFGKSGSGKSEILRCLSNKGEQVLDLERLAEHNGSAFGGLGGKQQPRQEDFEAEIKNKLASFRPARPVWVEYESNYLGRLQIPGSLKNEMSRAKLIVVNAPKERRVDRIVRTYSEYPISELLDAVAKIKRKISPANYRQVKRSIEEGDYKTAVLLLLVYYDRIYENGLKRTTNPILTEIEISGDSAEDDAEKILDSVRLAI